MHPVVRNFITGKRSYDCQELAGDPTILPSIQDAYNCGLILRPRIAGPSKSPSTYGVPRCAVVVGLTQKGELEAGA